ncbi:MAG: tRNA (adenosine(37)-N6)-threonylcarbamoyltransferase complex ATPase subunit type 1 TsaE [Acidimicrobiaceae bacterium]|nr:tRNA (adenosine(37)-N6)-threonylcarbamoyltransferase complex ATPase subunit type 1 TsaE [Acidimicrobiaceae bacterium]
MSVLCGTGDVEQTRALGGALAAVAEPGDVIVLVGELGAGKTAFVQGFAVGSGVSAAVTSPTFTLANRYEGRMVVNHLDVYRFESLDEADDLALPELLEQGVTLVEWGDTIASVLPADRLTVTIRFGSGDSERRFELRGDGATWLGRAERLAAAAEPWSVRDC